MGRGDKRTKKGKIFLGSYGKARDRKNKNVSNDNRNLPTPPEQKD